MAKLTDEQRRLRALFDSELGEKVLADWERMYALVRQPGDVHGTYALLGKQEFVQEIKALINYQERQ